MQAFPSLASPPPTAPYFLHLFAFPSCAFLETPVMQANQKPKKASSKSLCEIYKKLNDDLQDIIRLKTGINLS